MLTHSMPETTNTADLIPVLIYHPDMGSLLMHQDTNETTAVEYRRVMDTCDDISEAYGDGHKSRCTIVWL